MFLWGLKEILTHYITDIMAFSAERGRVAEKYGKQATL